MKSIKKVELSNGNKIPIVGLGTYTRPGDVINVYAAVRHALKIGLFHIDTAYMYRNEQIIGHAIADAMKEDGIKREDIFITSKCWVTFATKERVVECCRRSLFMLNTDYIDLYLIHNPVIFKQGENLMPMNESGMIGDEAIDLSEFWSGMEECVKLGLVKNVGVSNFNSDQIEHVLKNCTIKPVMNQVECHPLLGQKKLIKFCNDRGIHITAFSPFGGSPTVEENIYKENPTFNWTVKKDLFESPIIVGLAKKYNKTSCQILIKFQVQRGVVVIPKSFNANRIEENVDVFDFTMTEDEMKDIDGMDIGKRYLHLSGIKNLKNYPYDLEF